MKTAIAVTVFNRPQYLEKVLVSWAHALHFEAVRVPMFFRLEPVDKVPNRSLVTIDRFRAALPVESVQFNAQLEGALRNPYLALNDAFTDSDADFVILGEDDSVVSPDAMNYFRWAGREFRKDPKVLAVCSFQQVAFGNPWDVAKRKYFASVVWGTWRDRWEHLIAPTWGFDYEATWDLKLLNLARNEMCCVFPGVSRSQHIGKHYGTHMRPEDFEAMQADQFYGERRELTFRLQEELIPA